MNSNSITILHLTGDFSNAAVDLDSNSLTRFDEPVFRPMLEQMVSGTGNIRLFNSIKLKHLLSNNK